MRDGRLDLAEYERRLVVIQAAKVQKDLTPAFAGLPVHSGQTGPRLRISTAEREGALVRLADALTDGRLDATVYVDAEERLHRAVTYADLDAVVGNLDAKASLAERDQAIARIEAAAADGLLDPAEQHDRVAAARSATTDAQLAALVADLAEDTRSIGPSLRASNADREAVAAQLRDAVEAGLLDVTEFDERARAVYAARLRDELARLVADLPQPAAPQAPLPPAPPVAIPPRKPSFRAGITAGLVGGIGTFVVVGIAVALGAAGFTVLAVLIGVVWAIVAVVLAVWGRRTVNAAIAAESAPRDADWSRELEWTPVAESVPLDEEPPGKRLLGGHKGGVVSLTCLILPDGTPVAISGGRDNVARVWDLTDDSPRHTLRGHTHDVLGVAAMVMPDGSPVAVTVSGDRTARVWDLHDGSQRGALPNLAKDPQAIACLTLSDGTPVAVSRSLHGVIQMWDLRDRRLLNKFTIDLYMDAMAATVLPDGMPVAIAGDLDGPIDVMNLTNGKRRCRFRGHTGAIKSIDTTVLPDGTPIAVSVSGDKTIRVWDPQRGTLLHTIAGMISEKEAVVCTSLPDGTPIAVACDYEHAMVWDLRDGSELPYRLDLFWNIITGIALPDRTLILGPADDGSAIVVHQLP